MDKIIGIGNALVDLILQLENDDLIKKFNLPKGGMELIDNSLREKILKETSKLSKQLSSGGSAANTIHGLANLGMETGFVGSIGKDEMGEFFINDLTDKGIDPGLFIRDTETGTAITLVSKDSERTFATYLGAAIELSEEDIETKIFKEYTYCHIEGYLVMDHSLIKKIAETAKKCGLIVSLDLASYNVVEANLDFLQTLVSDYVDIVFANEEEAKAFTGMEPEKALKKISEVCEIAVVKTGKNGSIISKGENIYSVKALSVNCIDTTGAGDLYAAGFLYGHANSYDLDECGKIGTILAGNVIQNIGAKMDSDQWLKIKSEI
ncbi:adenosine kinase [Bacteroidota bacterium]